MLLVGFSLLQCLGRDFPGPGQANSTTYVIELLLCDCAGGEGGSCAIIVLHHWIYRRFNHVLVVSLAVKLLCTTQ